MPVPSQPIGTTSGGVRRVLTVLVHGALELVTRELTDLEAAREMVVLL